MSFSHATTMARRRAAGVPVRLQAWYAAAHGVLAVLTATVMLTPDAALACDATFASARVQVDADDYDGFRFDGQFVEFGLEIVNNGADDCALQVFFDGMEPMLGGQGTLDWKLVRDQGAVGAIRNSPPQPSGTSQDFLGVAVGGQQRATLTAFVYLPPSQLVPADSYHGSFIARLVDVTGGAFVVADEATVDLIAEVIERVDLSLAGELAPAAASGFSAASARSSGGGHGGHGGRVTDIDFGTLDDLPESRLIRVWVLANSGYWFTISSDNGGVMRHTVDSSALLAYQTTLDGQPIDLSGPVSRYHSRPHRGLRDHPLRFTISSIAGLPVGDYEDFVRITVTTHR